MSSDLSSPKLTPPGNKPAPTGTHSSRTGNKLVWVIAAGLVALAVVVLTVLPVQINPPLQSPDTPLPEPAPSAHRTESPTPPQPTPTARLPQISAPPEPVPASPVPPLRPVVQTPSSGISQQDAETGLQNYLRMRAQPDLQAADIWAAETWTKAADLADQGDEYFARRRFKEAQSAYQAATNLLKQLQIDRPQILAGTLTEAWDALAEDNYTRAIESFEHVLAMQAEHAQAQEGMAQATAREQVLQLMSAAQQAESAHDYTLAVDTYTHALQLDSTYRPAVDARAKVSKIIDREAYQHAMSRALSQLDSGNLTAAADAINAAAKLRPDAPALRDARQRLLQAQQQAKLDSLRKRAWSSAGKENWAEARDIYQQALSIDAQAAFARNGFEHAQSRLKLNAEFDHYLKAPERLASEQPLRNAQTLLDANPGSANNEPLLAAKIDALNKAVTLASQPVTLNIESDGQTEITVYHVGRLGRFAQKQLELRPGRYTVVGARAGFRDVRRVITLSPQTPARLSIRCEEAI